MSFNELPFLILLVAVYGLWHVCRHSYHAKLLLLLAASLVFYGYHDWKLLFLLLAYCLVDWGVGCWIVRSRAPRLVLTLGVTFNLLVLAYCKYTPLLLELAAPLARAANMTFSPPSPDDWVLPFGVSFYAFTGIAYMVDVYRGEVCAESNFWRFSLYKTFFPQLVAGPILRPQEFLVHLQPLRMPNRTEAPLEAALLLATGYFKKLVIADRIAVAIDPFFLHVADATTAGVWGLPYVYLYAMQIYFDFSAYTDIARGLGLLFGFRWPENFRLPYLAASVTEFWRRWHVTLSRFLKDYLYIPLGGNRLGRSRAYVNLLCTMLLGGLWHGSTLSFLLWGGLHGLFLIIHRAWCGSPLRRRLDLHACTSQLWHCLAVIITFHCVCMAWCFFRLTALSQGASCLRKWFVFDWDKIFVGGSADLSVWLLLALYGVGTYVAHLLSKHEITSMNTGNSSAHFSSGFCWGVAVALCVLAVCLSPAGQAAPFIYFQF